jgi:DNA-binding SARP family transcriptional activator/tetratricopeptide (TPR) repeat protein
MVFAILGTLSARAKTEVAITANRERVILAMLLQQPGQDMQVPMLIDAVWADTPPASARAQIHDCVSRLRKRLTTAGIAPDTICRGSYGYRANITTPHLDSLTFADLTNQARVANRDHQPQRARELFRQALSLWRGPALAGIDNEPVRRHAATLDHRRLQIQLECARLELDLGMTDEIIPELSNLVEEHPYHESAHRALMLAHYRASGLNDALQIYERLRTRLRDDLGAEPAPEIQQLHQHLLQQDRSPAPLRQAPPPAIEAAPTICQLPGNVHGFTGRNHELDQLRTLLPQQDTTAAVSVVTIIGSAGVGKTALAVNFARHVAEQFPGGRFYLDLRAHATDPPLPTIEALAMLLRSLGVPPDEVPTDVAEAAALYRSRLSRRAVLVVLDNAASTEQVSELVPSTAESMAIVTSRNQLGGLVAHHGAHPVTVPVLPPTDAQILLSRLLARTRPDITHANLAQLAAACAYLPLALRVAAANLIDTGRHPTDYLAELSGGDPLTALAFDDSNQAVRAAFDLSYRSVPAEARRLLRLFGIAPGQDLTSVAAAALTGTTSSQQRVHLDTLARAHLLHQHLPGRYTCHDLLRQYAKQLAEQHETPMQRHQALQRLMSWQLHRARRATELLHPQMLRLPAPQPDPAAAREDLITPEQAIAWLQAEQANLVAAVQHAARHEPRNLGWLLADALRSWFWTRGHHSEWRHIAHCALMAAQHAGDKQAQAAAHLSLGTAHHAGSQWDAAAEHYRAAATIATEADWREGYTGAISNLIPILSRTGKAIQAMDLCQEALAAHRHSGNRTAEGSVLGNLGTINRELGNLPEAIELYTYALAAFQEVDARDGQAGILVNLAAARNEIGDTDTAKEHIAEALAICEQTGNRHATVDALNTLAAVHLNKGEHATALELTQSAITNALEAGGKRQQAEVLTTAAAASMHLDQPQIARTHLTRALSLARTSGTTHTEAAALVLLAQLHHRLGHLRTATHHANRALTLATIHGYHRTEHRARQTLADLIKAAASAETDCTHSG